MVWLFFIRWGYDCLLTIKKLGMTLVKGRRTFNYKVKKSRRKQPRLLIKVFKIILFFEIKYIDNLRG